MNQHDAEKISNLLHHAGFRPATDVETADVVLIHTCSIREKAEQKLYHSHSGYPGGLKSVSLERIMATNPARVIEHAVKGMLPHNRLGNKMIKKLKVYAGEEHPHLAQTKAKES